MKLPIHPLTQVPALSPYSNKVKCLIRTFALPGKRTPTGVTTRTIWI